MKRLKSRSKQLGFVVQTSMSRDDSEGGCRDERPYREVSESGSLSTQTLLWLTGGDCHFLTGSLKQREIEMRTEEYVDPLRQMASELFPQNLRARVRVDLRPSLFDWEIGSMRARGGLIEILLL